MTVQVGFGPLWRIDGPAPQPPVYTLINASRVSDDVDSEEIERWINGVVVYPYPPDQAYSWDTCAPGSTATNKAVGGAIPLPEFGAMTVYLAETCSSFGIYGADLSNDEAQARFVARASASFAAVEAAAVEAEFMAGAVLGNNPHLADGNGSFPAGNTAQKVLIGFSYLENEIAGTGKQGVIHCSPAAATIAQTNRLLGEDRNGILRTRANGTTVVPGYGYAQVNSTPAGRAAAGAHQEWIYATGPVEVRRSNSFQMPGELAQALDRANNSITYRVERYVVVDWDTTLQSAVLVDWTL